MYIVGGIVLDSKIDSSVNEIYINYHEYVKSFSLQSETKGHGLPHFDGPFSGFRSLYIFSFV